MNWKPTLFERQSINIYHTSDEEKKYRRHQLELAAGARLWEFLRSPEMRSQIAVISIEEQTERVSYDLEQKTIKVNISVAETHEVHIPTVKETYEMMSNQDLLSSAIGEIKSRVRRWYRRTKAKIIKFIKVKYNAVAAFFINLGNAARIRPASAYKDMLGFIARNRISFKYWRWRQSIKIKMQIRKIKRMLGL